MAFCARLPTFSKIQNSLRAQASLKTQHKARVACTFVDETKEVLAQA